MRVRVKLSCHHTSCPPHYSSTARVSKRVVSELTVFQRGRSYLGPCPLVGYSYLAHHVSGLALDLENLTVVATAGFQKPLDLGLTECCAVDQFGFESVIGHSGWYLSCYWLLLVAYIFWTLVQT